MSAILEYAPFVLGGIWVSVSLAIGALIMSVVIGLFATLGRMAGPPWVQTFVKVYVTIFRGVPDLVWIFLIFYGGQTFINWLGEVVGLWTRIGIGQFTAGVVTLGLVMGAYMSETFRGAVQAIPKGQIEAALACGLSPFRLLNQIVRPQLFRNAYASFMNNWLGLIKASVLVSIIGLPDIVFNARAAGRSTGEPFAFLIIALIFYLLFTAGSEAVMRYCDKQNKAGGWSA